jgi:3-oxoacyl-[acyl-carrier protein] reductase
MTSLDNVTVTVVDRAWADGAVAFMSGNEALHPIPTLAAEATINAAAVALVRAFAEQGIKDGLQVNSSVPGAMNRFPEQAQISRFRQPEEVADLPASTVRPAAKWTTGASLRTARSEIKNV